MNTLKPSIFRYPFKTDKLGFLFSLKENEQMHKIGPGNFSR